MDPLAELMRTFFQVSSSWLHLKERTQLSLPAPLGEGKGGLLENKWTEMCVHFGIEQSTALNWYRKLWRCYGGYGRFYHTRDHLRLESVFQLFLPRNLRSLFKATCC